MKKEKKKKPSIPKSTQAARPWIPLIVLALLAILIYAPSLNYEWALDDSSAISDNFVTQKGFSGIGTHLTEHYRYGYWSSKGTLYRPVSLVMFAIEWGISPDNPFIHHLINLIMYALVAMLSFLLLHAMTKSAFWSFIIAALFVLHPVHVEAVANIKSRDEIMTMLFGLSALLLWWKYLLGKKSGVLLMALLAYALAMFSKESAVTLLVLFPALAFLFDPEQFKRYIPSSLLFLLPALIYLGIRAKVLGDSGAAGLEDSSPLDNLLFSALNTGDWMSAKATAILILGKYLLTLLLPFQLGSDFGFNQIPIVGFSDWRVLLSLLIHGGLLFLMFKLWKKNPLASFGLFFYFATISIFSNLLINIGSSYGERFLFLPSFGFLIFGVAMLKHWVESKHGKLNNLVWNKSTQLPLILCGTLAVFFLYKTTTRMPVWKNSFTLYSADIKTAPNSAKLNFHYALENAKRGKDSKNANKKQGYNALAKKHFEKALSIYPNYADALSQLGLLSFRSGDSNKAMDYYQRSVKINPSKALVYSNMGIIYFNAGQLKQAEEVYKKALEYDPRFVDAFQNLGAVYARQQRFDLAIENFRKGLSFDPNNATLNFYLGSALRDSGKANEGAPYLKRAKELGR